MTKTKNDLNYGLVVIGGGSGGLVAAETAKLGVSVALIERELVLGGECLHSGCVPSKALIKAARAAWASGHSQHLGVEASVSVNFARVMRHVNRAVKFIEDNHDNDEHYQHLGVDVFHGAASFAGKNSVVVNGTTIRAKRFIIATGSSPATPPIAGLDKLDYLTNDNIFKLDSLPKTLAVIGGGPIGCELGQAFAMLGSRVTILQNQPRLLPHDEEKAAEALRQSMAAMGVKVITDASVESVSASSAGVSVSLASGQSVQAEKLLLATGRRANLPENLELAGVATNKRGISVNARLQTTNRRIYAVGDCNGGLQFTHTAGAQAVAAVQNALFGLRRKFDSSRVPWTTFTTPEIAHLASTKIELDQQNASYQTLKLDYAEIDKAVAEDESGYAEIYVAKNAKILGATVVGTNAGEVLAAVVASKNLNGLAEPIQAYPTYAIGLKQAAANYRLAKLMDSTFGKLVECYLRFRFKKG